MMKAESISKNMDMDTGDVEILASNDSEEIVIIKEFVSNPKNLEAEDCEGIPRKVPAVPSKKDFGSNEGDKRSEKILDLSKIRSLMISAQERMRENLKKNCLFEKMALEVLHEVEHEKDNCKSPSRSTVSEKGEAENFVILKLAKEFGSQYSLKMTEDFRRRLEKIIGKKSHMHKGDDAVGATNLRESLSEESCKTVEKPKISDREDSDELPSKPSPQLKSIVRTASSMEHLQTNALSLNVNDGSTNQQVVPEREMCSSLFLVEKDFPVAPTSIIGPTSEPCKPVRENETEKEDNTKDLLPNLTIMLKSPNNESASPFMSAEYLQNNSSSMKSSLSDVNKVGGELSECVSLAHDITFKMGREEEVPVVRPGEQDKAGDPLSKSMSCEEVIVSLKRPLPFGEEVEVICPSKRIKVKSTDSCERVVNRSLENTGLKIQNSSHVLSFNRMLKVNLGYRCDSSEFQLGNIPGRNYSGGPKESVRHLRRIKTEYYNMNKENRKCLRSKVKKEDKISDHSLDTFSEPATERSCQRIADDDHKQHLIGGDTASVGEGRTIGEPEKDFSEKQSSPSKELMTDRWKKKVRRIKTVVVKKEPVEEEIEISGEQMDSSNVDFHAPKKEVEETSCTVDDVLVNNLEVLKIIKPVRVLLGRRCDADD